MQVIAQCKNNLYRYRVSRLRHRHTPDPSVESLLQSLILSQNPASSFLA